MTAHHAIASGWQFLQRLFADQRGSLSLDRAPMSTVGICADCEATREPGDFLCEDCRDARTW